MSTLIITGPVDANNGATNPGTRVGFGFASSTTDWTEQTSLFPIYGKDAAGNNVVALYGLADRYPVKGTDELAFIYYKGGDMPFFDAYDLTNASEEVPHYDGLTAAIYGGNNTAGTLRDSTYFPDEHMIAASGGSVPTDAIAFAPNAGASNRWGSTGIQAITLQLIDGGAGYSVNDTPSLSSSTGSGTVLDITVTAVSGGAITAATLDDAGYNHATGDIITFDGGTTGAQIMAVKPEFTLVLSDPSVKQWTVLDSGSTTHTFDTNNESAELDGLKVTFVSDSSSGSGSSKIISHDTISH